MKNKHSLITLAIATALSASILPAHAGAIADSYLLISGFTLSVGNGALGRSGIPLAPFMTQVNGANSGDVSASLNGNAASTDSANKLFNASNPMTATFNMNRSQGVGYVPGNILSGDAGLTFAGSNTMLTGSSLLPGGAMARTDNQVSLLGTGLGTAYSNVGLNAKATFTVTVPTKLELAFDAASYLRTMVDLPSGASEASYSWAMTLTKNNGSSLRIATWAPASEIALPSAGDGGTIYAQAFSLIEDISAFGGDDSFTDHLNGGYFEFETNPLATGTYTLAIKQLSAADATYIPEPDSIALFGLGLLGLAVSRRRAPL